MEQAIVELARRLGLEAERVWPQVVLITWLKGLFWSIADPILIVVCVFLSVKLIGVVVREYRRPKKDRLDSNIELNVICGFAVVLLLGSAMICLMFWPEALAAALYPEAQTVLTLAKGIRP